MKKLGAAKRTATNQNIFGINMVNTGLVSMTARFALEELVVGISTLCNPQVSVCLLFDFGDFQCRNAGNDSRPHCVRFIQ